MAFLAVRVTGWFTSTWGFLMLKPVAWLICSILATFWCAIAACLTKSTFFFFMLTVYADARNLQGPNQGPESRTFSANPDTALVHTSRSILSISTSGGSPLVMKALANSSAWGGSEK